MASTGASWSTHSCRNLGAIPSGPAALWGFKHNIFFLTFCDVMKVFMSLDLVLIGGGSGMFVMSSLVKTLLKYRFSSPAISFSSVSSVLVESAIGPIPGLLFVFLFTYCS